MSFSLPTILRCTGCLALAAALPGCQSVPLDHSGEMVAVYQFGEFRMLLNANLAPALRAAQQAVRQFDLYETSLTTARYDAQIFARAHNDQKVTLAIAEINSQQSLLRIRWGEGGDLMKSRRLYEAIEANLK